MNQGALCLMRRALRQSLAWFVLLPLVISGCRGLGQTPPPPPYSVESLGTAIALTENAPPPGYETIAFPLVDDGLEKLLGYHYTVEVRFEGAFDQDSRPASAHIRAEVWWDSVAPARRVVLDADGEVFAAESQRYEAVRLGERYYLVDENGRCLINAEETARAVAGFDAGSLVGGVAETPYSGIQAILNNAQAYRYDVTAQNAILPAVNLVEDSALVIVGELWIAPEYQVAVRYYANVDVSRVRLLEGEGLVSGQVFIRYDATDLGVVPNISIPYGC